MSMGAIGGAVLGSVASSVVGGMMGGSDGGSSGSSQVVVPDYLDAASREAISMGRAAAGQPFQAYTDPRYAEFTADEQMAFDLSRQSIGAYQPQFQQAQDVMGQVTQQGLTGIDPSLIQSYMDPYQTQVMDVNRERALRDFDRQRQQLGQQAGQIGAFGGSRIGLQEAQQLEDFNLGLRQQEAGLLSQGYGQALGAAQQGLGMAAQGALSQAGLAGQQQALGLQDIQTIGAAGTQQRALEQQGLDFGYQEFLREQQDPFEKAQFLSDITTPAIGSLAGASYSGSTQTPGGSIMGDIVGGAAIGRSFFDGGGFGTAAGTPMSGGYSGPTQGSGLAGWATGGTWQEGGEVKGYAQGGLVSSEKDTSFQNGGGVDYNQAAYPGGRSFGDTVGQFGQGPYAEQEALKRFLSDPNHSLGQDIDAMYYDTTPIQLAPAETLDMGHLEHMAEREGMSRTVYLDSTNNLTVGLGHKVLPEDNLKLGDTISDERIASLMEKDLSWSRNAAIKQAQELGLAGQKDFVDSLKAVNFQSGADWNKEHPKTWEALKQGNYDKAIKELKSSLWNKQTPKRVNDFIKSIERLNKRNSFQAGGLTDFDRMFTQRGGKFADVLGSTQDVPAQALPDYLSPFQRDIMSSLERGKSGLSGLQGALGRAGVQGATQVGKGLDYFMSPDAARTEMLYGGDQATIQPTKQLITEQQTVAPIPTPVPIKPTPKVTTVEKQVQDLASAAMGKRPAATQAPSRAKKGSFGVKNPAMLAFGLSLLSSKGDFGDQIGVAGKAYMAQKDKEKAEATARQTQIQKMHQQQIENRLAQQKADSYSRQVAQAERTPLQDEKLRAEIAILHMKTDPANAKAKAIEKLSEAILKPYLGSPITPSHLNTPEKVRAEAERQYFLLTGQAQQGAQGVTPAQPVRSIMDL